MGIDVTMLGSTTFPVGLHPEFIGDNAGSPLPPPVIVPMSVAKSEKPSPSLTVPPLAVIAVAMSLFAVCKAVKLSDILIIMPPVQHQVLALLRGLRKMLLPCLCSHQAVRMRMRSTRQLRLLP